VHVLGVVCVLCSQQQLYATMAYTYFQLASIPSTLRAPKTPGL